jgi:tetratricopeptide (TPR) repeat protein
MDKKKLRFISILFFITAALLIFLPAYEGSAQNDIIKLFSQGLEKETEGDCISAIFIYQDVLNKNKYFLDAKIALARCYYKTGNLVESEKHLEEAIQQDRKNTQAMNLLGRVLIALKKYGEAEETFRKSLEIEPINIETKYGLADLYRARGDYETAIRIYDEILKVYPQEVWTYLYLGTSYTEMGQLERAGGFFRKAASLDSESVWTHINLARHYNKMGVYHSGSDSAVSKRFFDASIYEADTALVIEKGQIEAHRILASVYFFNKDFKKALEFYKNIAFYGGADYLTYYVMGYSYEMLGDLKNAEKNYTKALSMRIDDEVTRFRLENILLSLYREELSRDNRAVLSQFHFSKGGFYQDKHVSRKAFLQYKRAIQLDPLDPEKRLKLADLMRADSYYEMYIDELKKIIRDTLDVNSIDLNDRIEIYDSIISKNIASRWNVSQYEDEESSHEFVPKTRIRVGVFDAFQSDYIYENFIHRRLSKTISEMLAFTLSYYPKIEVVRDTQEITARQDAMKKARELDLDYYVTGELEEKEDSLKARLGLLSGFNGKIIKEFEIYFTGNDKIFHSVTSLAEHINNNIPLQGLIVRLEGDRALINIGQAHGVEKEMAFHIIREGKLTKNPETGEYSADPDVSLGRLTVTEVDERVSEGTYTFSGLYNRVNIYNNIVLIGEEEKEESSKTE